MKMLPVLVAIAGERDLHLFRWHAIGQSPEAVAQISADGFDDVDAGELGERGRGQSGGGTHRYEARHSAAEVERSRFARHAAQAIAGECGHGTDARLLLVAGPKMLGAMREELAALRVQVAGEIGKDLVKVPVHELPAHLDEALRQMATAGGAA